jgi:nucleoside-diphosphate-sugar epimerase
MRVFVTGATGFIGSAVVKDLLQAGHSVVGLARSERSAQSVVAAGAKAVVGSIENLDSLRRGAAEADGVIHTAYFHAFSQASLATRLRVMFGGMPSGIVGRFMGAALDTDRRAIETMGAALKGNDRSLVVAFPTMALRAGRLATEKDAPDPTSVGGMRAPSEATTLALASRGVRASVVRLPPSVHGAGDHGLVWQLIGAARKKGAAAYVGVGLNRWPAVHRLDAARLFRLALEKGAAGARYHAVAEQGIAFKEIAEVIGRRLNVSVVSQSAKEAAGVYGWLSPFVAADNTVSSALTRAEIGWEPTQPDLLADIDQPGYFKV